VFLNYCHNSILKIHLYTATDKTKHNILRYNWCCIGDKIKSFINQGDKCIIQSKNNKGIEIGSYVHFEIIGNSTDTYEDNKKFPFKNSKILMVELYE
jgi:hypothetical protein